MAFTVHLASFRPTATIMPTISGILFSPRAEPAVTLFTTQAPTVLNASDGANVNYEQGTVFSTATAGTVTAIRFWKSSNETGTHIGNLWTADGQLISSVNFANETSAGWQQQALARPEPIAQGSQYVVSVNTGNTYYVATPQGLSIVISNFDLSTIVGNNGLYGSPGQFPTQTYNHNNYFSDIVFAPGETSGESLFTTQRPMLVNFSDGPGVNYEQGTVFSSAVSGNITAIRFWKASNESGTHVGHLWTADGQLLATVTFSAETVSGWQQQSLSAPVPINANTQYVVSVNTGETYYVATSQGLANQITNEDLSTVTGNNGLFGPPGQFPTQTYNHNNYFRDVVFAPN